MRRKDLQQRRSFTALTALLLCLALSAPHQLAAEPALRIVVVEGEAALNDIALERAHPPRVRIDDGSGHPVPGAAVTFALPDMGPGGVFDGSGITLAVKSDQRGMATGHGLRPNNIAGRFQIQISASHHGSIARAVVTQTNVATRRVAAQNRLSTALFLGAVAGTAVAVLLATRGAANRSPAPFPTARPITIRMPAPTTRLAAPLEALQLLDTVDTIPEPVEAGTR